MGHLITTRHFWRNRLPHWEVEAGRYFITLRCVGSLPKVALSRLAELRQNLDAIDATDPAAAHLQRRYFMTLEKYLDAGEGLCPFTRAECAEIITNEWSRLEDAGWHIAHWVIMPNHIHLLVETSDTARGLKDVLIPISELK
jgi:hypothetical protein